MRKVLAGFDVAKLRGQTYRTTTGNRCLLDKCYLGFSGPALRDFGPASRLSSSFPAGRRGCFFQGKVNSNKSAGHNTATQLHSRAASQSHSYTCSSAIHAPQAIHDSASEGRVTTLQKAVSMALELEIDENCMWNFARALKGFEKATGQVPELRSALSLWWASAVLPAGSQFEEYLWDLTNCFGRVKSVLGSSVLKNVEDSLPPLPDKPTPEQRMERLKVLCSALQRHAGKKAFYLSLRDVGRITGSKDPYMARNMMAFLISKGGLKCVKTWPAGVRKASEYTYRP